MKANEGHCQRCGYKKLTAGVPGYRRYFINHDGLWEATDKWEESGAKARISCPKCGDEWEGWTVNFDDDGNPLPPAGRKGKS